MHGPKSIKDFDPKPVLKQWDQAPFLEKMNATAA
jgi:hypothetical protein